MSVKELLDWMSLHSPFVIIYLTILPLLSSALSYFANSIKMKKSVRRLISILLHLSVIPGMFSSALVFYTLFIVKGNLLAVNALLYFAPIISMFVLIVLIKRKLSLNVLPGFNRLSGMMLMMFISCFIVLLLYRFRLVIGFFGSFGQLLIAAVILYLIFKLALYKMRSKKGSGLES